MALPSNVSICEITGEFARAIIDGSDPDRDPDAVPLPGLVVRFTADLNPYLVRNAVSKKIIVVDPIVATTNAAGVLVGPDGQPGVRVVASDDPDIEPTGWTYRVEISGTDFPSSRFSFTAPSGATVDLAAVVPLPPSPGAQIPQWQAVVTTVTDLRTDAVAAAVEAVAAKEAVEQVVATNDGIMTAVAEDEGTAFRAALSTTMVQEGTNANGPIVEYNDERYAPYAQGRIVTVDYTSTSVVTLPEGCLYFDVTLIGAGGGGGSGRRGAAGTTRNGGGSGGSGAVAPPTRIMAADCPTGQITVTIGGGGAGGTARTADNSDGVPGAQGGNTDVTTVIGGSTATLIRAWGGGAGQGGTNSSGSGGIGGVGPIPGADGAAASNSGGPGGSGNPATNLGTGSGGAGGGISAADVAANGGPGGGARALGQAVAPNGGGVAGGAAPANAFRAHAATPFGGGGGGGAASTTGAAQQGGSSSAYGAGGSGGGASVNGNNSGAGRNGAPGWARIVFTIGGVLT
ncbi:MULTISPECIES: hypothetical protein [unclassified Microbacterium]|uniref:glycine-rich domain-containing protein n=1 Tax=unclassified Microbacterium TaxID=2609290 RepID=UPI003864DA67